MFAGPGTVLFLAVVIVPFLYGLSAADFVTKRSLNAPTYAVTIVPQFIDLPLVFLLIGAHASQYNYLVHICII